MESREPRYVPVPWDLAGYLHIRLAEKGLRTTVCFVLWERQARLELCPSVDINHVLEMLVNLLPDLDWVGS